MGTKICKGKSHNVPTALPANQEFWFFFDGKPVAPCKMCRKKPTSTVACKEIKPYVEELVDRLGFTETIERTGLSKGTISHLMNEKCDRVLKTTASAIIVTLHQVRKEMRHEGIAWARTETIKRRVLAEKMLGY